MIQIKGVPESAMLALINEYGESDCPKNKEELLQLIIEAGDWKEKIDTYDIITTVTVVIGDWKFSTTSSQYRKDGHLCQREWSDDFSVRNINEANKKNLENWEKFFKNYSTDEIFEKLKTIPYPF